LPPPETKKNGKEKESNRSMERSRSKTKRSKSEKLRKKWKSTVLCMFSSFASDGVPHSQQGGE
jgi:hypothetical protein